MVVIAHEGGRDSVRESALQVDWEKNSVAQRGLEPSSELRLAFLSDAVATELSQPRGTFLNKPGTLHN